MVPGICLTTADTLDSMLSMYMAALLPFMATHACTLRHHCIQLNVHAKAVCCSTKIRTSGT